MARGKKTKHARNVKRVNRPSTRRDGMPKLAAQKTRDEDLRKFAAAMEKRPATCKPKPNNDPFDEDA